MSNVAQPVGASPFWSQQRTYDNVGNVLQLSTTLPTSNGNSLTDNQSYCYDALNRLAWAGNSGTPAGGDHCGSTPGGQSLRTNHTLGSLSLLWDRAMHWVFCAPWEPPVTVEGGGMFCVNVDKLDGHLWTPEERDLLATESYWERER